MGAGPAGLSAALILGRCRRQVAVFDHNTPRNGRSPALHGYLTRDGTPPLELRRIGREQLSAYPSVEVYDLPITDARRCNERFEVALGDGRRLQSRRLLLATGVYDRLPDLRGIDEFYGRSVFHCPYCDGWENRDARIAVYGNGKSGVGITRNLFQWSQRLVLCTDGPSTVSRRDAARLAALSIPIRTERIDRLEGDGGRLRRVVFDGGPPIDCDAMFIHTDQYQQSDLAERLGCRMDAKRAPETGRQEATSVPGLYVAGDASRDVQLVIVAAAEGAKAAFAINKSLTEEDLARRLAAK